MIFVTVGTHEQPFNRLIEEMDKIKAENLVDDEIIIQKGFSTYEPKFCKCFDMIGYEDMDRYISEARIVITHGGPASFMAPLAIGKVPIVVPRQKKFNEHVNDHQLEFVRAVKIRFDNIVVIEDISELSLALLNYDKKSKSVVTHNKIFNKELIREIEKLFK
jgi:UDP-N-acetylglucosamine transferase subunit ALG13